MRKLNVFFDVDHTLVMWDGRLRQHAPEVFARLHELGHTIYVWSGVGIRRYDMRKHNLDQYVTGYYVKPLERYKERLPDYKVDVMPDFVIDDYPQVIASFGVGYHISDIAAKDDRELLEVLRLIELEAARDVDTHEVAPEVLTEALSPLDEVREPEAAG